MRRYRFVRQMASTDCGIAALAMVCLYYGKEISQERLRDACGTGRAGTSIYGLSEGAKALGFETSVRRVPNDILMKGEFTKPAICYTLVDGREPHYVVLTKIAKDRVHLLDPGVGKRKISIEEFFTEYGGIVLLLKPTSDFVGTMIDSKSSIRNMVSMLMVHRWYFVCAVLLGLALTVIGIGTSFFSKILIDDILPHQAQDDLVVLCTVMFGISVVSILFSAARQHIILLLSIKIGIPIMVGYYGHIFDLPLKFFTSRKTGDIITRFQDTGTMVSVASSLIMTFVVDLIFAVISGIVLFLISAELLALTVILLAIDFILVFFFRQPFKDINRKSMIANSALSSAVIDNLRGISSVKANTSETVAMERIKAKYSETVDIGYKASVLSNYQGSFASGVSSLGGVITTFVGASMIISGDMTLGTLMAFTALSGYFTGPMSDFIGFQFQFQEADIAHKRLNELFQVETDAETFPGKTVPESLKGDVVLEGIRFRYGSGRIVLDGVDMVIQQGSKVAIVGESGCGKSTLCNLIAGLWPASEGTISVNGYTIQSLDIRSYRGRVSYIQQEPEFISGTIRENIDMANPNATDDDIRRAMRLSESAGILDRMPQGLDTYLEEAGANLSGGEKQRLAFARAFVRDPDILILDESTSGLDYRAERNIYRNLFDSDVTTIIIAHRLSTIRSCDRIFVLNNGRIEDSGTHDDLIGRNGLYRALWESQVGSTEARSATSVREVSEESVISYGFDTM